MIVATPQWFVLNTSLVGRGVSRHTYPLPSGVQRHNGASCVPVLCEREDVEVFLVDEGRDCNRFVPDGLRI